MCWRASLRPAPSHPPLSPLSLQRNLNQPAARAIGLPMFGMAGARGFVQLAHPPFNQQLQVDRAGRVVAEAIVVGLVQLIEAEVPRAPFIGAIEKRTMMLALRHAHRPSTGIAIVIGNARRNATTICLPLNPRYPVQLIANGFAVRSWGGGRRRALPI